MLTIHYPIGNKLYLNITNRCHCQCTFCIRQDRDSVGGSNSLWLEHEPSLREILDSLQDVRWADYQEVVFCGYGEPTERLDILLEVCRFLRQTAPELPIRLNTNGLGDMVHGREIAPLLAGWIDVISISLNAPHKDRYLEITRPALGDDSFDCLLQFAASARNHLPRVLFSVVDVISPEEIAQCQALAAKMGIPLRVRELE